MAEIAPRLRRGRLACFGRHAPDVDPGDRGLQPARPRIDLLPRAEAQRQAAATRKKADGVGDAKDRVGLALVDDAAPGIGVPVPETRVGPVFVDGKGVVEAFAHGLDHGLEHGLVARIAARPEAREQQGAALDGCRGGGGRHGCLWRRAWFGWWVVGLQENILSR